MKRITFDSLFNFWGTVYKFMVPEFKCWIFNQLNEGNKKTPRMWPIYNQPFQKNPCDLFLNSFSVGLCKKVQHGAAEVVSVAIWVPQLICNCMQEEIPTFSVQIHSQVLEDVHVS